MSSSSANRGTAAQIAVQDTVVQRMRDAQLDTSSIQRDTTFFLLPEDHAHDAATTQQLQQIMQNNTRFSDEQLMRYLAIAPAEERRQQRSRTTTYYMRSWRVPPATMFSILEQWNEDQVEYATTNAWFAWLLQNPNEDMHIRYVGMTNRMARERHNEDILQASGILGKFYNTLQHVDPNTFNNIQISYFYRATTSSSSQRLKDLREQIIIAFFWRGQSVEHAVWRNISIISAKCTTYGTSRTVSLSFFSII